MSASRLLRPSGSLLKSSIARSSRTPSSGAAFRFQPLRQPIGAFAQQRRSYADEAPKEMTVRDALNEALAEELEQNEKVFVLGEEVAQYNGAYKVTKGLLDRFGEKRVIDRYVEVDDHQFVIEARFDDWDAEKTLEHRTIANC
jgi:pyruvate dehydrogenase E1 component beta subunit